MPPSPLENSTHPSPMLSPCTDQRNERHSALQPHTGTGGKHSVATLTQQNPQMHKHTLAHTPTPINSQTSGPQHSTTYALTLHFCIKKIIPTLQMESSIAGKYPATHVQTEKQLCARSVDMLMYMHAFALHIFISTMLEIVLRKWVYSLTILWHSL